MIIYLLQISIVFSALYLVSHLIFSKLTFHSLNRFVLLICAPISCLIPFASDFFHEAVDTIIIPPMFDFHALGNTLISADPVHVVPSNGVFNLSSVIVVLYCGIVTLHLFRIIYAARKLYNLKINSTQVKYNRHTLIQAKVSEVFSYFNWIFVPLNAPQNKLVLDHEIVHIESKHSWDVILIELYIAFFWFNPFVYPYRKSLKSIHEFQADQGVLQNGIKASQYMQLILDSLVLKKPNNHYNYFNLPIIKRRVLMITKPKSKKSAKLSYLLLLPICIILISAFTFPKLDNVIEFDIKCVEEIISNPPTLFPVPNGTKADITAYFEEVGRHKINKGLTHGGIDIKAPVGTPVIATAEGIVSKASSEKDWGNLIVITHSDGFKTWYAHLNNFDVKEQQKVQKGDVIGYVGSTGRSTGPHLHYEVTHNGERVDPMSYIE